MTETESRRVFQMRFNELLDREHITQKEIASICGVSTSTVSTWSKGLNMPRMDKIEVLANHFNLPKSFFIEKENVRRKLGPADAQELFNRMFSNDAERQKAANAIFLKMFPQPKGIELLGEMDKVPLVGRIACGTPILAEENIEDYVDLPKHIKADYALECRGDSMIGAGIRDGDIVYIKHQEEVENGQIAAVLIDGEEATLKRFYFDGSMVQLIAENPKYAPIVFTGEDINKVQIIGRAVAFTHSLV